jgi:anti-anti-sigma factor
MSDVTASPMGLVAQEGGAMALLRLTCTDRALLVEGDVDLANADELAEALRQSIASGVRTVDLSGVSFLDSEGLRTLMRAALTMDGQAPLVLRGPSRSVRRLLDVALPTGAPGLEVLD